MSAFSRTESPPNVYPGPDRPTPTFSAPPPGPLNNRRPPTSTELRGEALGWQHPPHKQSHSRGGVRAAPMWQVRGPAELRLEIVDLTCGAALLSFGLAHVTALPPSRSVFFGQVRVPPLLSSWLCLALSTTQSTSCREKRESLASVLNGRLQRLSPQSCARRPLPPAPLFRRAAPALCPSRKLARRLAASHRAGSALLAGRTCY